MRSPQHAPHKEVRMYMVAKQWFRSLCDMNASLRGQLQRYSEDPLCPYEFFHHPTKPWLSGPIDGRIFNFLGRPSSTPSSRPPREFRGADVMNEWLHQSKLHGGAERQLGSSSSRHGNDGLVQTFGSTYDELADDVHYTYRTRVAKWKRVVTHDLAVVTSARSRSWWRTRAAASSAATTEPDDAIARDVRYLLACNNSVTSQQLTDTRQTAFADTNMPRHMNFLQYVGEGVAHTTNVARELWREVILHERSVIAECILYRGVFIVHNIRHEKRTPNHMTTILPALLICST